MVTTRSLTCARVLGRSIKQRIEQPLAVLPVRQQRQVCSVQLQRGQLQEPGALPQARSLTLSMHAGGLMTERAAFPDCQTRLPCMVVTQIHIFKMLYTQETSGKPLE